MLLVKQWCSQESESMIELCPVSREMEWTAKLVLGWAVWGDVEAQRGVDPAGSGKLEAGAGHTPAVVFQCSVHVLCTWKQLGFPPGMPMSDQYVKLEEERRHKQKLEKDKKKKKQKKEKRGKHHRHNSLHTESEEDIAPAHHVDIITEEMPEVSSCAWGLGFICVQLFRFLPPQLQPVCDVAVPELFQKLLRWPQAVLCRGRNYCLFFFNKNCHWSY